MNKENSPFGRRQFLQWSALTAGMTALTACAGKSPSSAGLGFSYSNWQGGTDALFEEILADYETKASVTIDRQALVSFSDYQTRFRTLLSGGSPPDVMRLNDDFLRELSDKEQILDLTAYIKKSGIDKADYFENVFDFTLLPRGQSGIAIAVQPRVIFYNKTLFEAAGVPLPPTDWSSAGWEWDDFLEAAKALTTDTDQWGTILNKDTGYENTFAVNNGGPGIFSTDGRSFTLADDEGIEAIQWVADLAVEHKVSPPWAELGVDQIELSMFVAGKLGMLLGTFGSATYFRDNVTDFEWDVAPIPAKVEQKQEGSMVLFVIPTKSKNPDAAWDFLEYLSGPEGGSVFAKNAAFIPVNRAAAQAIKGSDSQPKNIALFIEAASHQASVNSTSATAEAVAIYRPQLERVYTGEISAREALTGVRDQVEAALSR